MMRRFFPSIIKYKNHIFCDNAGGSQLPSQIIKSFEEYLIKSNAQPYCNNIISKNLTQDIDNINNVTNILLNNISGKIVYGTSCTQLVYNFANSLENYFKKTQGNIILPNFSHESCVTPFERIAKKNNLDIKWWNINKHSYEVNYDNILDIVDTNTSFVVLPHVSNILGNIIDIKYLNTEIKKKNPNTLIFVDGVAHLPHKLTDVHDYGVDYYIISYYKFCGLRLSAMYIKDPEFTNNIIQNQNHYFYNSVDAEQVNNKLQLGGINFELASGVLGLKNYFIDFAKEFNYNEEFNRNMVKFVMNKINDHEKELSRYFEKFIKNNIELDVIQDKNHDKIPLYSFRFQNFNEKNVNLILNELGLLCKTSAYHCNRLYDYLEIDKENGLLRISLMHYNSLDEVNKIIECLKLFKKEYYDFDFLVDYQNNWENSYKLKSSFDNLDKDNYYKNRRNRAYSLLKVDNIDNIKIVGDLKFYQSSNYNMYNGDLLRYYKNIDYKLITDNNFKNIISKFVNHVNLKSINPCMYIHIHQIRVYVDDNVSNILPEGIHQDGFNMVGIVCVKRENIVGGINNIYNDKKEFVYSKQLEEGELLIINDKNMYHDVTSIERNKNFKDGYRDIFVLTTIS